MKNKLQNLFTSLLVGGILVLSLNYIVGDVGQPQNLPIWATLCSLAGLIGLMGLPEEK